MRSITIYILNLVCLMFALCSYANETCHAPNKGELRQKLTPMQYHVTQEHGTEPAYNNRYWSNTRPGIYVDIITGAPLFSTLNQYDAKTGWPSFTQPINPQNIIIHQDRRWFISRVEVIAKGSDAHLGYLFFDGPTGSHEHYSINSAALHFIPADDLAKKGYGQYVGAFFNAH